MKNIKEFGTIANELLREGESIIMDYNIFKKYKKKMNLIFLGWKWSKFGTYAIVKVGD